MRARKQPSPPRQPRVLDAEQLGRVTGGAAAPASAAKYIGETEKNLANSC